MTSTSTHRDAPELVSVVIPTYNAGDLIDAQLAALAQQDYTGPFEVIVSDNGSTDGLGDRFGGIDSTGRLNLEYHDSSDKQGASHARNSGAAAASGDLLAFCDGDDVAHTGWLTGLVEAAIEFDAVGGILETATINSAEVASWRQISEDGLCDVPGFLPFAHGSNFAIWADTFAAVGGFDESFLGGEDIDICWRIQQSGHTLGFAPNALVAYRLRDSYRSMWRQIRGYGEVDAQLFARYQADGLPRRKPLVFINLLAGLVFLNPLVPRAIRRTPTGHWVMHAAWLWGRVRGSVKHRVFYV
ncbi:MULTISPECIES: glycosyltransferase family 2 protein [unclassified Rhodococcus (in: high G+C Gram-positive bacteria)]|uniref:glycosyltransferase n=1 Tax=unclassified Rhodococcus (in: high G+C Gram-positive bacteria) TaxID=192944 RepID=UPI000BCD45DA|nr:MULTISPECIES: glycosyltransferase [unclassified Rhodococcus (in: high G+C Gram-positive bacteria)]MBP1159758.1 glycosyltransferase involved in cell wall biosynthesis [Rhodococcus sp. PvR099]PTR37527.1 GT2 family glycosyltransferase [Rhodococcus sp. OK611]SNX93433.1 Glycosyltransferase, GT2 family [Rhodococcus sp. OK270]